MLRAVLTLALLSVALSVPAGNINTIDVADVFHHLHALQKIANVHGSRAVATGYNDSASYVKEQLALTDLVVTEQFYVVPIYTENAEAILTFPGSNPTINPQRCALRSGWQHYESACDYSGVRYGGSGKHDITSTLHPVGNGCSPSQFADFPRGKLALISAGQCEYYDKGINAEDAGAAGVVLYNDVGVVGLPGGRVFVSATWREGDRIVQIPFVGVTNTIAMILQQSPDTTVRIQTDTSISLEHTSNILAETKDGDENHVVMIGAHLDGVPEGPGINDNGSGTCTVLAIAQRLSGKRFKNKIRFGWWGAEEIGLLGSRYYVRDLAENHPEDLAKIAGYLNFDMEASPNYIRLVYNGTEATLAQEGSEALMHLFEEHFHDVHLSYAHTSMGGGSDFLPFILAGIPSSGMAAGASGLKTADERAVQGGLANTQLDPCYHAPCDSVDNVSPACISELSAAAIDVLTRMANNDSFPNRVILSSNEVVANLEKHRDTTSCISDEERPEPK